MSNASLFHTLGLIGWVAFFATLFMEYLFDYVNKKQKEHGTQFTEPVPSTDNTEQEEVSRIAFTRTFGTSTASFEVIDALLDYIANLDTISQLKYSSFYFMDTTEEFVIEPSKGIVGRMTKVLTDDSTGAVKQVCFYVQSADLSITELREWINDVHSEYTVNKNNELGSRRYFFNQLVTEGKSRSEKQLNLTFDMSVFDTTKTLSNLYGDHISQVETRINLFKNKAWYQKNGVPHTLGILLHGQPGCGKTSLIKAIANDTNRHVFNIRLSDNMTKEQLNSLFFDPKITVRNKDGPGTHVINIPLNQRLYVLEDIDCAENTVLSREQQVSSTTKTRKPKLPEFAENMFGERELDMLQEQVNKEKEERIDLAFLLNILDGVLETPQRLIIMTTNYVHKLDPALLRPGRIDLILEFRRCTLEMLLSMVQNFFDNNVDTSRLLDEALNEVLTPAEVQEILCSYFNDANGAITQICKLVKNKVRSRIEPLPLPTINPASEERVSQERSFQAACKGNYCEVIETPVAASEELQWPVVKKKQGATCLEEPVGVLEQKADVESEKDLAVKVMPAADADPFVRKEPDWLRYHW